MVFESLKIVMNGPPMRNRLAPYIDYENRFGNSLEDTQAFAALEWTTGNPCILTPSGLYHILGIFVDACLQEFPRSQILIDYSKIETGKIPKSLMNDNTFLCFGAEFESEHLRSKNIDHIYILCDVKRHPMESVSENKIEINSYMGGEKLNGSRGTLLQLTHTMNMDTVTITHSKGLAK